MLWNLLYLHFLYIINAVAQKPRKLVGVSCIHPWLTFVGIVRKLPILLSPQMLDSAKSESQQQTCYATMYLLCQLFKRIINAMAQKPRKLVGVSCIHPRPTFEGIVRKLPLSLSPQMLDSTRSDFKQQTYYVTMLLYLLYLLFTRILNAVAQKPRRFVVVSRFHPWLTFAGNVWNLPFQWRPKMLL